MSVTTTPATPPNPQLTTCHYVLTSRVETPVWSDRRACGNPLPCPDHTADAASPELTDELAEVLAEVLAGEVRGPDEDGPADNALTAHDRCRAEQKRAKQAAALSVLAQLGLVHATHDGEWFAEWAGREAMAAREVAAEAARRKKLADSYAAVVAELHAIADSIGTVPIDGLAELTVEVKISTKLYGRNPETDPIKVATVDAVALAVLGKAAASERLSDFLNHKAEGRRGPVKVEVHDFINSPEELEREAELERLRAELADTRAALALIDMAAAASGVADYARTLDDVTTPEVCDVDHENPIEACRP